MSWYDAFSTRRADVARPSSDVEGVFIFCLYVAVMGESGRVLIGSGIATFRASLRLVLEQRDLSCMEAVDATTAVEVARCHAPDVALIDVDLGLDTARRLVAEIPTLRVIALGDADPGDDLWAVMRAGASGYLPRDLALEAIAASALGALAGEAALPRALVPLLIAELRRASPAGVSRLPSNELTPRERDVLDLLARGQTTAEIGAALYIAKVTVRTHIASIRRKLRCQDRASAVQAAGGAEAAMSVEPQMPSVVSLRTAAS